MRFIKLFGILLLVAFAIGLITSLVLPAKQRIERSIVIKAPASVVYEHIKQLNNFDDWAVWNGRDTVLKTTLTGEDGKPGTSISWTGHPEISGDGKIVIRTLNENKKIVHDLNFLQPKKGEAESEFILTEANGVTTLTWEFDIATPRPKNIFNLFSSLDKTMGKDFESGLIQLKSEIEKKGNVKPPVVYDVKTMNFPNTTYAFVRQQIKWSDIGPFYTQHLPLILGEVQKANLTPGTPSGMFFAWDEMNQQADMAAAMLVPEGTKFESSIIQVMDIPASKALFIDYYGAYDKSADAYASMDKYLADNKLKQKVPVIEQYITDPGIEKDTAKWLTKIIFLVE